jgi:hypothetical protein
MFQAKGEMERGNRREVLENAFVSSNIGLYLRTFSPRYFSLG